MAGRRSVWSDPRLIELARRFVPAADEVWRLQRGKDEECLAFQRLVNGGEPITDLGTRQGIWVGAPSGVLLSHVNSLDPDVVAATLERGLAAWKDLPPEARRAPPGSLPRVLHRWEEHEPEGGLVLERIVRELPAGTGEETPDGRTLPWNRDFAWFSREEVASLLPRDAAPGEAHELPPFFARRLARFHLVDNARGQTLPYAPSEVRTARLTAQVLARKGPSLHLRLEGDTRAVALGPWLLGENLWKPAVELPHGIATRMLGDATLDVERGVFTDFRLVAVAQRWGRTQFNGRGRDDSPGLLAFHLEPAGPAPRIAPTFVALYDPSWIEPPAD